MKPDNPYEGIVFVPAQNKYAATIPNGRHAKIVGHFDTLDEAAEQRRIALHSTSQGHDET